MNQLILDPIILPSFLFNIPFLLIIFILFLIVYVITSVILIYHWFAYGIRNIIAVVVTGIFVIVSSIFLTVGFLVLNYF